MTSREPTVGDKISIDDEDYWVYFVSQEFGLDYEDEDGSHIGTIRPEDFAGIVYADEVKLDQRVFSELPELPTIAEPDNVNHPVHYTSHPSGVECITIVRHYNFNVGGAMKYLWRNGLKDEDAQIEDLQKAIWLIEDEIKRLQETTSNTDLTD